MKLQQRVVVSTNRSNLWDLLMDVERVGRCFPGVEQVTTQDNQTYQSAMRVRVGPVSLNVAGTLVVVERDRDRWRASLRLQGADRRVGGAVHATVVMDLTELSPEETELAITSDVSFLGKLGELGQPVIQRKTNSVFQEFASNLKREAAAR